MNKRKLVNFIFISALSFSFLQAQDLKTEIESIRKQYAPDKREHIFEYEIETNNQNQNVIRGVTTDVRAGKALKELIARLNLASKDLVYLDSLKTLPAAEDQLPLYGVCRLSVADIRTNPSYAAEMASQSLLGVPVRILEYKRGWYRVRTPDNYLGWINSSSIQTMTGTELTDWLTSPKVIVVTHNDHVLKRKKDPTEPVCDVVMGDLLRLKSKKGKWIEVALPDGREGFIASDCVKDFNAWYAEVNPSAESLIRLARTFMGLPYTWGGTSAKMLDCSGFMRTIYFMHGIYLNRDASQQVKQGQLVNTSTNKNALEPGDLLFFGTKGIDGAKDRITHVGMYIGNGEYIHEAGLVHVSSFDPSKDNYSSYYDKTFICARRILGNEKKNIDTRYLRADQWITE